MKTVTNQYLAFGIISLFVIAATRFWYFSTSTGAILTLHARELIDMGKTQESFNVLDEALHLSRLDGNRRLLAQLAILNTELKRDDQAIEAYLELFKTGKPPSLDQAKELLILFRFQKRFPEAIAFILREDIQESIGPQLQSELVSLYTESGLHIPAVKILQKQISGCEQLITCSEREREVKVFKLKLERAALLSWAKEYDQAREAYEELLDLRPEDPGLLIRIADLLAWNKQFSEAADVLSKLMTGQSESLDLKTKQVFYLFWSGRYAEAEKILESNPEIIKKDPTLLELSINHKMGIKDFDSVQKQISLAMETFKNKDGGDYRTLRLRLAEVLSWSGKYDESLRVYKELVLESPEDIQLRRNYATVLSWAGKHEESASELRKTLTGNN